MTLLEYLKFKDWISKREFEDSAWIVVARSMKTDDTDLFTISVLAKATSDSFSTVSVFAEKLHRVISMVYG